MLGIFQQKGSFLEAPAKRRGEEGEITAAGAHSSVSIALSISLGLCACL